MIKSVLQKTLLQKKRKDLFFRIWSWIYTNSNDHNIYYGTLKEICDACHTDHFTVNKALELQYQWNTVDFEKTIVIKKDDKEFVPFCNNHPIEKYSDAFRIDFTATLALYRPVIVVFNDEPFERMDRKITKAEAAILVGKDVAAQINEEQFPEIILIPEKTEKKPGMNEKGKKVTKGTVDIKLRDTCCTMYIDFYKALHDGTAPPIDGVQMRSLQLIIKNLQKMVKVNTNENVILSLQLIFDNWKKYPDYMQKQLKLQQINSNLANYITYIKGKQTKTEKIKEVSDNLNKALISGALNDKINNLGKKI